MELSQIVEEVNSGERMVSKNEATIDRLTGQRNIAEEER